jgi:uncharacterized membrane protein YvbJ
MKRLFFLFLFPFVATAGAFCQANDTEVKQLIIQNDSFFWRAYNNCDINGMNEYLADDVKFYHDKGGYVTSLKELESTIKQNLCGNNNFRLRREEVKGTVEVHILKNKDSIYGVIMSGQHVFYVSEKGKKEFLDGLAKFTHLWLLENNSWKMKTILSYDHGPADRLNKSNGR